MTLDAEARLAFNNLHGNTDSIARYIVTRCGDFVTDGQRAEFIAAFLVESKNFQRPFVEQAEPGNGAQP